MPSDFGERRARAAYPPPGQAEHLACPRCESTNTKFCYYNNYNLSQPRHFCKGCRRYWTQGGTLRNIPVGGGTRKSSKRSRPSSSAASSATSPATSSAAAVIDHQSPINMNMNINMSMNMNNMITSSSSANPISVPCDVNLNEAVSGGAGSGSFTSLLGSHQGSSGSGFLALGGYGLGPSPGFDEMGPYGFGGRGIWAFPDVGNVQENGGAPASVASGWHLNGVDNGLVDGDCFAWPDLAISMPGQGLK